MSSVFDDEATLAMGAAFDQACSSLGRVARGNDARELIAKRIIDVSIMGGRDPVRLHSQLFMRFCMDDLSVPVISGPREKSVDISTANARTA
jgi:hypothetical protein